MVPYGAHRAGCGHDSLCRHTYGAPSDRGRFGTNAGGATDVQDFRRKVTDKLMALQEREPPGVQNPRLMAGGVF